MDNLDRTNVVQSLLARRSLILQTGTEKEVDLTKVLETPWKQFEKTFKSVWVNNANAISMGYAGKNHSLSHNHFHFPSINIMAYVLIIYNLSGTGALKVDFTKTGKRTFSGMIDDAVNSCMRYYINNFTDGVKQDAIDILLLNYQPGL